MKCVSQSSALPRAGAGTMTAIAGMRSNAHHGMTKIYAARSRGRFGPHDDTYLMRQCIVMQPHDLVRHRNSIYFQQGNTAGTVIWILDRDAISGVLETVSQLEVRPIFRYNRVDRQSVTAALEAQNFLEPDAICPSRRACVPGPAAASDMAG